LEHKPEEFGNVGFQPPCQMGFLVGGSVYYEEGDLAMGLPYLVAYSLLTQEVAYRFIE